MTNVKSIKTIILVSLFLLFLGEKVIAQMYTEEQTLLPSPQVWSFMRYGSTPVNLYTGTLAVDIPIYTYKDNDFEIPISIGYASNGLRPGNRGGILGKDWFLNTGGVITREVRGYPDEASIDGNHDISGFNGNLYLYDLGVNDEIYDREIFWQPYYPDNITMQVRRSYGLDNYEVQNDIFHYSFMGFKGSFIVKPKGEIEVFHTNTPKGEIKIEATAGTNKAFTISTGDGYKYYFTIKEWYHDPDEHPQPLHAISSWFLEKITAPNGREVVYEYNYGHTIMNHRPATNIPLSPGNDYQPETGGIIYRPYQNNLANMKVKRNAIDTRCLVSITINDLIINFSYHHSTPELTVEQLSQHSVISSPKLKDITIQHSSTGKVIEKATFEYDSTTNGVMFLRKVKTKNQGSHEMDYYDRSNYPTTDTFSIDKWGYYNAQNMGDQGKAYFIPTLHLDQYYNESVLEPDYRAPNYNAALKGTLKTIVYPTKGKTEFFYEPHTYSGMVHRNHASNFLPGFEKTLDNSLAGGIRIKKIVDYSENNNISNVREFEYVNDAGKSSGILLNDPRYSMYYHAHGVYWLGQPYFGGWRGKITGTSQIQNTLDKTHMEYSQVKEKLHDGSYTIHYYINYSDYDEEKWGWDESHRFDVIRDLNRITIPGNLNITVLSMDLAGSLHHYRGRISHRKVFNSNNILLETEDFAYYSPFDEILTLKGFKEFSLYDFDTPTGMSSLKRKIKTQFYENGKLETKTEYTYNSLGQCIEERTTDSQKKTIRIRRQFAHDQTSSIPSYVTDMKNKNNIRHPLKEITTLREGSSENEFLTTGKKYFYKTRIINNNLSFIVPDKVQSAKINTPPLLSSDKFNIESYLSDDFIYSAHDKYGNLVHSISKDGSPTTYIWGYNGMYLVAIIENKTPSDLSSISGLSGITTAPLAGALSSVQENALRGMAESLVTTYTHEPYVGITSITDPSGMKVFYRYDASLRLSDIIDKDGNIIEKYEYRFKEN